MPQVPHLRVTGATRVALGRPRVGEKRETRLWRVRATTQLDTNRSITLVTDLAERQGRTRSEVIRDAVAEYAQKRLIAIESVWRGRRAAPAVDAESDARPSCTTSRCSLFGQDQPLPHLTPRRPNFSPCRLSRVILRLRLCRARHEMHSIHDSGPLLVPC